MCSWLLAKVRFLPFLAVFESNQARDVRIESTFDLINRPSATKLEVQQARIYRYQKGKKYSLIYILPYKYSSCKKNKNSNRALLILRQSTVLYRTWHVRKINELLWSIPNMPILPSITNLDTTVKYP